MSGFPNLNEPMKADEPIVAEVRKARAAHARRFGYDLTRICRDLKWIERECNHSGVRGTPRHMLARSGT
jgi:dTDP-D-glucose 4,6-dehydratase